jgi:hypothetical protein
VLRAGAGGPITPVDVPGAVGGTAALDINGHGAVVGIYGNPDATAGPALSPLRSGRDLDTALRTHPSRTAM